jgi:hypothetical protein
MPEESGSPTASAIENPASLERADLDDWWEVPTMIEGASHTYGTVIHKGPDGESECGVWECTPGYWDCEVTRDEFCQFLCGSATYTHESGEVKEIEPGKTVFFPAGWTGTCRVHETVRKVYICR